MAQMQLLIQTLVHDKNGKLIRKSRKRLAKSFVKAWLQHVEVSLAHAYDVASDTVAIRDTSNVVNNMPWSAAVAKQHFACEAPANDETYGIRIGTGVTAPATEDYKIETPIVHGVGAGQLQYGAMTVQTAAVVGLNMDLVITRSFTNGSGNTITVKEVGIVLESVTTFNLITHDAVDDAVLNTETYTVQYTFRTTV